MSHITKIAAVETSTAIWEYDPSLANNRVLGGSLDVIAAIRTVAIKVRVQFSLLTLSCPLTRLHRFKPLVNGSRCSKSSKSNAGSRNPSRYLCTAMSDGVPHSLCSTGPTNFARSRSLVLLHSSSQLICPPSLSTSSFPLLTNGMAPSRRFAATAARSSTFHGPRLLSPKVIGRE
jgi:hypothetical protein